MFEKFINANERLIVAREESDYIAIENDSHDLFLTLMKEAGASSYKNGLYRIHNNRSSIHWSVFIEKYFNNYVGKVVPFGYDWLGRQFCIHKEKSDLLLMFDPATGDEFQLEQNLIDFHNNDLVDERDSILAQSTFVEVLEFLNIRQLEYRDCLGYRTPLFLGGKDTDDNYEVVDLEVYWDIQCQLLTQIRNLPPGTKIQSVKYNERK